MAPLSVWYPELPITGRSCGVLPRLPPLVLSRGGQLEPIQTGVYGYDRLRQFDFVRGPYHLSLCAARVNIATAEEIARRERSCTGQETGFLVQEDITGSERACAGSATFPVEHQTPGSWSIP